MASQKISDRQKSPNHGGLQAPKWETLFWIVRALFWIVGLVAVVLALAWMLVR